MEYEIRRINTWSVIKIVFLVSFFIGALIGIFYALILSFINNLIQQFAVDEIEQGLRSLNVLTPFFLILFFAIFTSISNSIISAIFIGIYNFMAQWIGGIKIDIKPFSDTDN